jgi:hypothetical protein
MIATPKKIAVLLIFLLGALLFTAALCSCSSTHKLKSTTMVSTDIVVQKNSEQILLVKKDSAGYHQKDSIYKEVITIDFDTTAAEPANDYESAQIKPLRGPYVYNIGGNTVKSPARIKSATIERNGHKTELDVSQVKTTDSLQQKTEEKTQVFIEEKKTTKDKTSRHTPFAISLLLLMALVAVALYSLRRYKII